MTDKVTNKIGNEARLNNEIEKLNDILRIQRECITTDEGDSVYNAGLYNGIELCVAFLESREPKYYETKVAESN